MNLWAKRIGQLALLAVVLFFLSCEDEASLLGYKNPNTKFELSYVEIPIESSVLLLDSQRTSNFLLSGETNRLLVGQYVDDKFGTITSSTFTQYFTNSAAKLSANAAYDSVTLQLQFDLYSYGSPEATSSQQISVYELDEELQITNRRNYFNKSELPFNPTQLGTKNFTLNPVDFQDYVDDGLDTAITITMPLDYFFGQRIFDNAIKWRDFETTGDSTFKTFELFTKLFKGLTIQSDNGDKVVGFNPNTANSSVILHYHTADKDSLTLNLGFFGLTSFNNIKSDRSGSALEGLSQYSEDFIPDNDLRYIQSGAGIATKLDFGKFFEFADTVPNIVINSAQLTIDGVEQSDYRLPSGLVLSLLQENNLAKKLSNKQDTVDLAFYNPSFPGHRGSLSVDLGTALLGTDQAFFINGDQTPLLSYSDDKKSYNGNYSLFFQQLSILRENKSRYRYAALVSSSPGQPSSTKTVNRATFPKSGITLKIYYTKPTTPLN